ncbi:nitrate reductase [Crucibulum laeve]|uniref:Nitrate reductase [NADPH] n=1 Tax=Crucibulum laeve TaxID=68775 RepID=A0A5C3LNY6_9AGAR|nr:nitrate reductase [Crucibulum laeve]
MKACVIVNPQDIDTPDAWVLRDPRLVRLTGKHPFNAESKLQDLYAHGFLTPSNLFFVRNHGAVPQIDKSMVDNWKVVIHGHCRSPATLTITDLMTKFKVVTIPVTLVCAGNRRKEQNVVQKSLGFSWGAGGVSTALFTGVYLADVLEYIGPTKKAKHVVFEGYDKLPKGPYGTSQLLSWAKDRRRGMMLAWAMNGQASLEPDHGYPLRLVVPSQIGGRSVKWLSRIELSEIESQHYLHFHDNKVLPMPACLAPEKPWWYDPRYIIRDLNTNSAIACPDHDEVLDMGSKSLTERYILRGYAYAGGGRRVTRVEVTFDEGSSWQLANISYPEDSFREVAFDDPVYGSLDLTETDTCFCWCFWTFEASLEVLRQSKSIAVRAMDESLALQPRDMYWNATGMMNNWWFRVCIHELEGNKLRFEHPTMAGTQPGGWMQRLKDAGHNPAKPEFSASTTPAAVVKAPKSVLMVNPEVNRKITPQELKERCDNKEPLFVVHGEVYDGAAFLDKHPGGPESITLASGEDTTDDFVAIHSTDARKQLAEFHIGTLVGGKVLDNSQQEVDDNSGPFLNAKLWKSVVVESITDVSKDCKIYRFTLPRKDQEIGLPVGHHVYVRLREKSMELEGQSELVQRPYTPVSRPNDKGFIDMLIKLYYPEPRFPAGGRMSLCFAALAVGESVELRGPIGHFIWIGNGIARISGVERHVEEIGMICGGSGITPMIQIIRAALEHPEEQIKVWLLSANREYGDILCKEELDQLALKHSERFKLHYTLTGNTPTEWQYSVGRINPEMLVEHLPSPSQDKLMCICGPSGMESAAKEELEKIGWDKAAQIVLF